MEKQVLTQFVLIIIIVTLKECFISQNTAKLVIP